MSDQFRSIAPLDRETHKAALASLLASFRSDLPQDYVEFLTNWDGGEGFFGDDYVVVDGPVLALGTNVAHGEFANPIQFIGGNGGGEAIAFDLREGKQFQIVMAPFIGTDDHATWVPMASNFTDLISGNFSPEFRDYFSGNKA